jgi:iron complex outermembrane receptor protein
MRILPITILLLASTAAPAWAQSANVQQTPDAAEEDMLSTDIVVIAERIRGAVDTDVPPVEQLNENDIAAVGASSITDLVAAIAPQTGSGRGRGGGQPVVLLNGQRISGFRELRDLPPEAIKQVQVFPEEVALQYGYRPDQRVINFILKDNFASFSTEAEFAAPEKGEQSSKEFEATLTRIGQSTRFNVDIEYETATRITEDERDIISSSGSTLALGGNITGLGANGEIDPALSGLAGQFITQAGVPANTNPSLANFATNANILNDGDVGAFRTLVPKTERFEINTTWSKSLGTQTSLSLNGNYSLNGSASLLGLPGASFVLRESSPFSPFSQDVVINRYFDAPRALERKSEVHSAQFGSSLNTLLGGWRLAVTGNYSRIASETRSTRNVDFAALRVSVLNGTANPFAAGFGGDLLFLAPDLSDSLSQNLDLRSTLSGSPLRLPAGEVRMTFSSGFNRQMLDSEALRSGITTSASLRRNVLNNSVNVEFPLTERESGLGRSIGEFAINGNIGFSELSDFGSLMEYGAGIRWSPFKDLTFQASIIGDENAPGIGQLGNPLLVTPNVATYDFTQGESLFINVTTGGNPLLVSEKRRDFKLGLNWSPSFIENLGLQAEYFRNNSSNTTAPFPLLTPEIEAAFASRVVRDADGRLVSIDQRPVNFAREKSQRIRWGFNVSGNIGPEPQQGRGPMRGVAGAGRPESGPPRGTGAGRGGRGPGGGGPRMGGGGGFGPGGGMSSRWNIALYHTYRIQEEILIGPGVPVLDLLNGSATSSNGGAARHELELSSGVFHKGLGFRLQGNYRSGTTVDGSALLGSSDLRFGDLTTLTAFMFVNLDQQEKLVKRLPFLKGSRITLRVDNVLNDVIDVRDDNGLVPLGYQRDYLDPRGRVFELSFRKRF